MKENNDEPQEEIINTNSNQINEENIIIPPKKELKEKNNFLDLNEINTEFNENIFFTHFYLAQRAMDFEPRPTGEVIPYLMSRDFLYSYFEDKKNYKNATKETYPQILGRVKQFMNSNDDNFNKIFLDHFTYYWEILGKKNAENILIPVLSKITEDRIGTRIYFLKKLKNFLEFFEQLGENGIEIIKNNILNIIEQLYRNKLTPEKIIYFLPKKIIITEEEKKEYENLLFERLIQICKILIKTKYKQELYQNILLLMNDKNNNKKNIINFKKTCMSLIILVEKLKIDFIGEYIINFLEKISNDKFWILRKKSIEILYKIIPKLKKENQQNYKNEENKLLNDYAKKIIALIEKFIEDKNEKVKFYLMEKIGEIIKVCPEDDLSQKLFNFYIKSIEDYYSDEENLLNNKLEGNSNTKNINFYFWYNFPTILSKYGKEKWDELKNVFKYITKEENIYTINIILSSFYQISQILGKEIAINELLPLYNSFLEKNQGEIKDLAEKYLYKILSILDKETREEYFNKYKIGFNSIIKEDMNNNYKINNRIQNRKIAYLKNILTYFKLYDNDTIYKDILSKCIYFSMDQIYKVRTTSCKIISEIILYLYQNNYQKEKIIKLLGSYALNKKSMQRISFIKISKALLLTDTNLYEIVLKRLLYILVIKEQNSNVLIALAKILKKIVVDKNAKNSNDLGIHYMCKKINNGKIMSISRIFRNVKIQKIEGIDGVGDIFEENMFVQNNIFFEKEFGIQLRKKNCENSNIVNDISKENKFIN